jgi:ABC-type lipoprotein export system ATPase subunit
MSLLMLTIFAECTSNSRCASDGSYVCDRTHIPWLQKNYGCFAALNDSFSSGVVNGGYVEFNIFPDAVTGKNGTAAIYGWKYPSGPPLRWSCATQSCVMRISADSLSMTFDCAITECKCGSANVNCDPWKQEAANRTVIQCDSALGCYISNEKILGASVLNLTCSTGECKIPVDNAGTIAAIVVVPLVILLSTVPFIAYAILMCKWQRLHYSPSKDHVSHKGLSLRVSDLQYFVYDSKAMFPCGKKEEVQILRDISFDVKPAKVTAIIGVAGAGKTTLLDILAGFEKKGRVRGAVLLDGRPLPKSYRYLVGYVLAEDKLLGTLTVFEQLMYTAHLRLPPDTPLAKKREIVEDIIKDLGLLKVRDTRIGDEAERGVSGGEKRRVSIATQLVTSPRILILDEPTTGLGMFLVRNSPGPPNSQSPVQMHTTLSLSCRPCKSLHKEERLLFARFINLDPTSCH